MAKKFGEVEIGETLVGTSITITDAQVVLFAGLTGDYYHLHMNEEAAKQSPFGTRIAHGPLTFVIGLGMIAREMSQWAVAAALGFDSTRFLAPVKIGDTITPEAEVVGKTDKGNRGIVSLKLRIKTQDDVVAVESAFQVMVNK